MSGSCAAIRRHLSVSIGLFCCISGSLCSVHRSTSGSVGPFCRNSGSLLSYQWVSFVVSVGLSCGINRRINRSLLPYGRINRRISGSLVPFQSKCQWVYFVSSVTESIWFPVMSLRGCKDEASINAVIRYLFRLSLVSIVHESNLFQVWSIVTDASINASLLPYQ